jgi:SAM-dependent methyltransferase
MAARRAPQDMQARDWDRIAADYFDAIVSPFETGPCRPLLRALDAVPHAKQKTVADLGCGVGPLLPELARRFRRVLAVDFSAAMLRQARAACAARNVRFRKLDLARADALAGALDVVVTVNAVLATDPVRLDRTFAGLAAALKTGGRLIGIFPAMEPVLYQAYLIHERERGRFPARARARTRRILEATKYDFLHATYDDGHGAQKFFYEFELRCRLRNAGFRRVRFGRVPYRWDQVGGYERFPGAPPMWDWLVTATRT